MSNEELESQLSAMFDDELPATGMRASGASPGAR